MTTTTFTTAASVIGDKLVEILSDIRDTLQLQDIWLGDQQLIPRVPAICVRVGNTEVELVGAPRRVQNTYNVSLTVFHCKLTDNQEVERECNQRAEAIRDILDNYDSGRLDGLVLDSMVTLIEPGFTNRGQGTESSWYKTSRITWTGTARYNLTFNP